MGDSGIDDQWERGRPKIKNLCKRCRPRIYYGDLSGNRLVVSPQGTAHWGDGGDTACGIDATGGRWWWPL